MGLGEQEKGWGLGGAQVMGSFAYSAKEFGLRDCKGPGSKPFRGKGDW